MTPYRTPATAAEKPSTGEAAYAASLREALPGDILWLDREGNACVPALRIRNRAIAAVLAIVSGIALCLGVIVEFPSVTVRVLATSGFFFYGLIGAVFFFDRSTARAERMLFTGRLLDAEREADRILSHRILAAGYHRVAHLVKARIATGASRYADALDHYRAIRYAPARPPRRTNFNCVREVALLEEVVALCRAGAENKASLEEARALLERAVLPSGDYLTLKRDVARLALAFASDEPARVSERDVQEMRNRYERLASGYAVLALVGWRAHRSGRDDIARRAIHAELSKPRSLPLAVELPILATWIAGSGL
jgi:hypothetical protein